MAPPINIGCTNTADAVNKWCVLVEKASTILCPSSLPYASIDCAIGELLQLGHKTGCGIGNDALRLVLVGLLEGKDLLLFKVPVLLQKFRAEIHRHIMDDHLRQGEIVLGLHAQADVSDLALDDVLASRAGRALDDDVVPSPDIEIALPIAGEALPESLPEIQAIHLGPQINQSIGGRSAC